MSNGGFLCSKVGSLDGREKRSFVADGLLLSPKHVFKLHFYLKVKTAGREPTDLML